MSSHNPWHVVYFLSSGLRASCVYSLCVCAGAWNVCACKSKEEITGLSSAETDWLTERRRRVERDIEIEKREIERYPPNDESAAWPSCVSLTSLCLPPLLYRARVCVCLSLPACLPALRWRNCVKAGWDMEFYGAKLEEAFHFFTPCFISVPVFRVNYPIALTLTCAVKYWTAPCLCFEGRRSRYTTL